MAFLLSLSRDKTYELLDLTVRNGARPVIVLEDPDEIAHELFIDLLFADRVDTEVFDYGDFIMDQAFSMEKIDSLSKKAYIIVENVKHLYGKSATSRILADFVRRMRDTDTGVIFTGKRTSLDMAEFIGQTEECIQYVISVETEK